MMNDWPNWFTEPIATPSSTTPAYRLALVTRRFAEMRELLNEVRRVVGGAVEGEHLRVVLTQLTELQRELMQAEAELKTTMGHE